MGGKTTQTGGKTALITGITGQDGAYLARLLLDKGYHVHGVRRRSSSENSERLERAGVARDPRLTLHYGDLSDGSSILRLFHQVAPDEFYNLAAQSHVQVSFETAEYCGDINGLGVTRLLEGIRTTRFSVGTRFYQASTSEMFGSVAETPQSETTAFRPCSPYANAKLYAFGMVSTYRQAYGLHASNGILFNHESPLRGEAFVTRKITKGVAAIATGRSERLVLGNLDALRDWGHARDYVDGMWLMLQQDLSDDYVLATGVSTSVRQFVEWAFAEAGISLDWRGTGFEEKAFETGTNRCLVEVDPSLFRPAEVHRLQGDARKARDRLGWVPKTGVRELVREMVQDDLRRLSAREPVVA